MKDVSIKLENVDIIFPVYNAANKSLKNRVLSTVTGGKIDREYDGVTLVKGLTDINLEFRTGERIGLVGHNGSGKTTLLRVLSGIYWPTSGTVNICGDCVSLINIGLGIDQEATGRENIYLRAVMMGMKPKEIQEKIDDIIDFTGLGDFIDLPFRTYSSGMQLRLAFAVSTGVSPQILIMDEWLSTGDEEFRERANKRMSQVVGSAKMLILASHDRDLIRTNCNRVLWLEQGKVKMDGKPEQVLPEYFG